MFITLTSDKKYNALRTARTKKEMTIANDRETVEKSNVMELLPCTMGTVTHVFLILK